MDKQTITDLEMAEQSANDTLLITFHNNLMYALDHHPDGKSLSAAEVSRRLGISKSVVSNWTKKKSMPSIYQLVGLSRILDRDVKWLLEDHDFSQGSSQANWVVTYTDAFRLLRRLISVHAIDKGSITDYFLRYMIKRFYEIEALKEVPKKEKTAWMIKLSADYDVPIMKQASPWMYSFLEEEFRQMDEDRTSLRLLHLMQDYWSGKKKNELDAKYTAWMQKHHPTELETQQIEDGIKEMGVEKFFTDPF